MRIKSRLAFCIWKAARKKEGYEKAGRLAFWLCVSPAGFFLYRLSIFFATAAHLNPWARISWREPPMNSPRRFFHFRFRGISGCPAHKPPPLHEKTGRILGMRPVLLKRQLKSIFPREEIPPETGGQPRPHLRAAASEQAN